MARYKVPKLESATFKGWAFVVVAGLLLATLALIDRGGADLIPADSDGSTGCVLEVTTEELNVRAGPSQNAELLDALRQGSRVDGTPIVTDGFRQLEGGRWASNQFLAPVPGTTCN
ncbi:MAG TPA: SH3 domain-containing protein [Pseudonocardia sp.]|nr:SH3 domain-containing protein [Pseudonocardia sp.]